MAKISILPDILCNQIAAGEVVERPAAVVKELLENSIDAGSSKISVSLIQGGRKEIRVIDNGCGMSFDDALLAIERHATSKIRTSEDLQEIRTLGFRGEALPSIASVSRFELISREHESLSGVRIKIEGGTLRDASETGCPPGTQVLVRDLFHNVPGRRKFMRTAETELSYISDQLLRIALAHPEIHLQLFSQDRALHDFPRVSETSQRAGQALGPQVVKTFSPVDFQKGDLKVRGFLASPHVQRTNSQSLFLFVNGRPVWDRLLQRTVITAYEALIPRGKFPVALLFISVPPSGVDVNVHPAKREIRFKNPGETTAIVREALLNALAATRPKGFHSAAPVFPRSAFQEFSPPERKVFFREAQAPLPFRREAFETRPAPPQMEEIPAESADPPIEVDTAPPDFLFSALPVIGRFANAFILLEAPDGLVLIDQHAAHERVLFNELSSRSGPPSAQLLTKPAVFDLMPGEAVLLRKYKADLASLGFEIEPFGGTSFAVHAVPGPLSDISPEELVRDFLKSAEDALFPSAAGPALALARIASCRGAVKAGRKLKDDEIRHLLASLDKTDCPFTCPHGRPLWVKLSHDQILRLFKRT